MAGINYDQLVIRFPDGEVIPPIMNRQIPSMTMISDSLIPGVNYYLEGGWIYNMPEPNPGVYEMVHKNYDELLLHIGGNSRSPYDLGAEIEFELGGKSYTLNTTSSVWLPKGAKQGPIKWKKVVRPHIELSIIVDCGDAKKIYGL